MVKMIYISRRSNIIMSMNKSMIIMFKATIQNDMNFKSSLAYDLVYACF